MMGTGISLAIEKLRLPRFQDLLRRMNLLP